MVAIAGGLLIIIKGKQNIDCLFAVTWMFLILFLIILLLVFVFDEFMVVNNFIIVLIIFIWLAAWLGFVIGKRFKNFKVQILLSWTFGLLFHCIFNVLWLTVVLSMLTLVG